MTMTVYKTIIKITIMYSIGTAPFRGQDLAAYRLRFTLFRQHYTIILLLLQAYYDVTLIAVRREKSLRFFGGFSLFVHQFLL